MDRDLYVQRMQQLWMLAQIIENEPLEEVIKAQDDAESVVWFTDPTLVLDRDKMAKFREDRLMCKALRSVQIVIKQIRTGHEQRAAALKPELKAVEG